MNSKKIRIIGLATLLLLLSSCTLGRKFNGSSTGNEDQFIMSYDILNMKRQNKLNLKKDDSVNCEITNNKGKITVQILNEDKEELVTKNYEKEADYFTFKAPKNGEYIISVDGKKAKGNVSFIKY
ncbi:hypothetical protein P7H62_07240 [Vagococcus carniphilus]|uniref:Lipoprotein n=1 Tax=Vagococcus carniphilus TaxID=218144 RepID=A0AAW8U8E1_9ENTE|nr:hypothetical protein [Vagococcus carniphilus]MDT2832308.1 hypothetical protein [Vagococcus carniphilus]MDT2833258.1 hypothetical protein [Vagococcus carniphilus]MDT2839771.1 hypothetical protein [Vagococcus carniphilus]MDT2854240.1 hypothetical protein [Vagococcus carniphilus]